MPRIHEMPTHLNVEDTLLGPLTPSQLVRLAAGLSLAYITWDQLSVLPDPLRAALAGLLVLVTVMVACCRPAGVGLDAWALAGLAFALASRRLAWARPEPDFAEWRRVPAPDWAELEIELGWNRPQADALRASASWHVERRW
jgi:hypothetical protein